MNKLTFLMASSFYPPYHIGGDATHVKYLSEALADRGHEVHVLHSLDAYTIKRGNRLPLKMEESKKNLFIHTIKSPIGNFDPLIVYTFGFSPYISKKFSKLINAIDPQVVHHHNLSLLGYNLLKARSDYFSIYTAHDYWLTCQTNNLFTYQKEICKSKNCTYCSIRSKRVPQLWRNANFNRVIRDLDLIISPSEYVKYQLKEIKTKKIVIPNFVPLPPKHIPKYPVEKYFLYLGMLERHKGILELLNLFNALKNKLKSKLIIAGGGSLRQYIIDYIHKNSLNDSVSFLGFVDYNTKYSLYKNAIAVIIPSIWSENAPLVALEALSIGTPVISSDKGGLPEILAIFDRNLIFSSWAELRDLLLNLTDHEGAKVDMNIFNRYFSTKVYVENYLNVIAKNAF
jgi:glycosyltransferase involved in cell wall biosynthesis